MLAQPAASAGARPPPRQEAGSIRGMHNDVSKGVRVPLAKSSTDPGFRAKYAEEARRYACRIDSFGPVGSRDIDGPGSIGGALFKRMILCLKVQGIWRGDSA